MSKYLKILGIGVVSALFTLLFCGYYLDSNDGEYAGFIKHKPSFKQIFYSPKLNLRYMPRNLTKEEVLEENAFQEFIINENNSGKNNTSALYIIQLAFTATIFSLYGMFKKRTIKAWQLITHYIINVLYTGFCIALILLDGRVSYLVFFSALILFLNLITLKILNLSFLTRVKPGVNS